MAYQITKTHYEDAKRKKLVIISILDLGVGENVHCLVKNYGKTLDLLEVEIFAAQSTFATALNQARLIANRHGYNQTSIVQKTVETWQQFKKAIGAQYWYSFGRKNILALFPESEAHDLDLTDVRETLKDRKAAAMTVGPDRMGFDGSLLRPATRAPDTSFPVIPTKANTAETKARFAEQERVREYAENPEFGAFS